MPAPTFRPNLELDITNEVCPMTFVRTKLALEALEKGQILGIRLNAGEPLRNVPRAARAEGHTVVDLRPESEGASIHRLLIRKA
jgi:tRNA 2-thiouridine synthesizing protein A